MILAANESVHKAEIISMNLKNTSVNMNFLASFYFKYLYTTLILCEGSIICSIIPEDRVVSF